MMRLIGLLLAVLASAAPVAAQQANPDPAQRISMAEFQRLQADNKVLVIDVREPQSYAVGHIPGARSIPLGSLLEPARVAELKATTKPIVLYCA
jgi:rhodanese-related sulfurtransferase